MVQKLTMVLERNRLAMVAECVKMLFYLSASLSDKGFNDHSEGLKALKMTDLYGFSLFLLDTSA